MHRILIIVEDGRLGNQLFQYFAIKNLYNNHIIIFFGFSSLLNLFPDLDGIFIFHRKNKLNNLALKIVTKLKSVLIKYKIFSIAEEYYTTKNSYIRIYKGLFKKIIICKSAYFQCTKYLNLTMVNDFLKSYIVKLVKDINLESKSNIFLHIRRGDYKYWPSKEYPAICPLDWYMKAVKKMSILFPDSKFLIFTDDFEYVQQSLPLLKNIAPNSFEIIHGDESSDFLRMIECVAGILSPSSFSWWASYFSNEKNSNSDTIFLAPKFWAGHTQKSWFPCEEIKAPWIQYLAVENLISTSEYS